MRTRRLLPVTGASAIAAVAAGGNTNAGATWDSGTVPTAADDVVLAATSGPVTINADFSCRSLNASAYTNTLTHNAAINLNIGDAGGGSLTLSAAMTYTKGNSTTSATKFISTTAGNTITTAGKSLGNLTVDGAGGAWTCQDALTTAGSLTLRTGTFDTGNQNQTWGSYGSAVVNNTRQLNAGSSTITLTGTGTVWTSGSTLVTTNTSNATLVIGNNSATTKTVSRPGTWAAVSYTNAGTGTLAFTTSGGTLGTLTVTGAARAVTFAAGASYTLTGTPTIGAGTTLQSSAPGTAWNLIKASGLVSLNNLTISDSHASGGAQFYAGSGSTNGGGNTGWAFIDPVQRVAEMVV